MKLDRRILRLIAVGASIAANCQSCLQTNATEALKEGVNEQEIAEAIEVGKKVRQGTASKMDKFIANKQQMTLLTATPSTEGCECNS